MPCAALAATTSIEPYLSSMPLKESENKQMIRTNLHSVMRLFSGRKLKLLPIMLAPEKEEGGCTREDTYTCTNNDTLPIWEVGVLNPNH